MYLIPIMPDHELMIGSGMSGELKASSLRNCLNWLITPRFSSKYLVENVDVKFSKRVVVYIFPLPQDTFLLGKLTVSSIVNYLPTFYGPPQFKHLIQKKTLPLLAA